MSDVELRRLTPDGLDRLNAALDQLSRGEQADIDAILFSEALTEVVSPAVTVRVKPFTSRLDAAEHFFELLCPLREDGQRVERDAGMWAWLAALWIDQLAPATDSGARNLGARARWVPQSDDFQRYYRHLLAGPYQIYAAHHDDPAAAMCVLATDVARPGEVAEQLAARQEIVVSRGIVGAATVLYFDSATKKLKRGAGGKGAGSARRLSDVISQLDLTHDIYAMSSEQVLALLPSEFAKFR